MIELAHMHFIDRKKKERIRDTANFIHSQKKNQDAKEEEEKKSPVFYARNFQGHFFSSFPCLFAVLLLFIVVIYGVLFFFLAYCASRQRHQYAKSIHVIRLTKRGRDRNRGRASKKHLHIHKYAMESIALRGIVDIYIYIDQVHKTRNQCRW